MPNLSEFLKDREVETVRSRRTEYSDLLSDFLAKLNPSRIESGFSLLSYPRIAREFKRAGISPSNLYSFFKECERAHDFSRFFWWRIKTLKAERKKQ